MVFDPRMLRDARCVRGNASRPRSATAPARSAYRPVA